MIRTSQRTNSIQDTWSLSNVKPKGKLSEGNFQQIPERESKSFPSDNFAFSPQEFARMMLHRRNWNSPRIESFACSLSLLHLGTPGREEYLRGRVQPHKEEKIAKFFHDLSSWFCTGSLPDWLIYRVSQQRTQNCLSKIQIFTYNG